MESAEAPGLPPPICLTAGTPTPLFFSSRGVEESIEAAWLREIDACFGRLGGLLERQLSLINPLSRSHVVTPSSPVASRGSRRLVQSVSSCITCCRMMMGGAIASCGPFFSLIVVDSETPEWQSLFLDYLASFFSSLRSNTLFLLKNESGLRCFEVPF